MPLPEPKQNETRGEFLLRCMADETARREFPNDSQRYAVCNSQAAKRKRPAATGGAGSVAASENEKVLRGPAP